MKFEVKVDERIMAALAAFEGAATWDEYRAAKRLASKCDRISQLAMVDSIKAARNRIASTIGGTP